MLHRLFAAAMLAVSAPVTAPVEQSHMVFLNYPMVHKVSCSTGSGTAFRLGGNRWASVAHVTAMTGCEIDGDPISLTEQDGRRDFSRFDTSQSGNGFGIDCHGFIPGQWYWAVGHAKGLPFHTAIAVYATYAKSPGGKRVLIGPHTYIPGMSGGPVLDAGGNVVGTVNAYKPGTPISLSTELRSTSLCGADLV